MNRVPRRTFGSRGIASYRYHVLARELGAEHPAARAALGRLWFYNGRVPQSHLVTIEAIAWHRESGTIAGYRNRAERRARGARA